MYFTSLHCALPQVLDIGDPMIALFDNGDKTRETENYCTASCVVYCPLFLLFVLPVS